MSIRAVVLDLGDVLEVIDDSVFPGPWEERLGLRYRLGILSSSGAGTREHEAVWGLEQVCDAVVYSHEVGLAELEQILASG